MQRLLDNIFFSPQLNLYTCTFPFLRPLSSCALGDSLVRKIIETGQRSHLQNKDLSLTLSFWEDVFIYMYMECVDVCVCERERIFFLLGKAVFFILLVTFLNGRTSCKKGSYSEHNKSQWVTVLGVFLSCSQRHLPYLETHVIAGECLLHVLQFCVPPSPFSWS